MDDIANEFEEATELLSKDEFIQINPENNITLLANFDLYKKMSRKGKDSYVLFHTKGSSLERRIPGSIYIKESVIEDLLRLTPNVTILQPELLSENLVQILLNDQFQSRIIDNHELDIGKKIEYTVRCAGEVMRNIFSGHGLNSGNIETVMKVGDNLCRLMEIILLDNKALITLLHKIIGTDYTIYNHSVNVSFYSGLLAMELDLNAIILDEEQLRTLVTGAILHDIGKTLIDPKIIHKNSQLNPKEYEEIKKHPVYGLQVIKGLNLPGEVRQIILQHHEKWTGGGYPHNISYQQISNFARITCICDVFDALTTEKSYRKSLKPFDALLLMKQKMIGKFYQPYLSTFIKFLGKGPNN